MKFVSGATWLLILFIRGLLLWALVPLAALAWLLVHNSMQDASPRQVICWYDSNPLAALAGGLFRFVVLPQYRPSFVGLSAMRNVVPHKLMMLDLSVLDVT